MYRVRKPRTLEVTADRGSRDPRQAGIGKSIGRREGEAARPKSFPGRAMPDHAFLQGRLAATATGSSLLEDAPGLPENSHLRCIDPGITEARSITMVQSRKAKIVVSDDACHLLHGHSAKSRYRLAEAMKIRGMASVITEFISRTQHARNCRR
jgi:hypothetical protein